MPEIMLTRGLVAIVDEEDFAQLSKFKWYASKDRNTFYAVRRNPKGKRPKAIRMHREILGYPPGLVDHKNRNGLDNRRENLRRCTPAQNQQNRRKKITSKSSLKGITWHAARKKWQAQIKVNKKNIYLGLFKTEEQAAKAYDEAATRYFGEFARGNVA